MKLYELKRKYLEKRKRLLKKIYKQDLFYRDSTTPILELVMNPSGSFAKGVEVSPVIVEEQNSPLVSALFIIAHKMSDTLQVGFFEAVPDRFDAVNMLVQRARSIAKEKRLRRIVIGLDGHVNNRLGIFAGPNRSPVSFGSGYNPLYYIDYLEQCASSSEILVSYQYDILQRDMANEKKVIGRVSRRFQVRKGNFRNLRKEIELYTHLSNECFQQHPLYFERTIEEDYELFKSFSPFLKEENFLVAELDKKPIGFLLWYPDFHELVKPGKRMGIKTLLKYHLAGNAISRFKIAEFGILPQYQASGVIIGLIDKCIEIGRKNGYRFCESGWIFDSNIKSKKVVKRWADEPYKIYKIFEIEMGKREK